MGFFINKEEKVKIFEVDKNNYGHKVNFVDENNVVLGYDMSEHCCENADWFISKKITKDFLNNKKESFDVYTYVFDKKFCNLIKNEDDWGNQDNLVVFRLVSENKPDLFIHLFNCHNGYYSHGFEFKNGTEIIKEDYL